MIEPAFVKTAPLASLMNFFESDSAMDAVGVARYAPVGSMTRFFIVIVCAFFVSCTCGGDENSSAGEAAVDRIALRLLDQLDDATVTLGTYDQGSGGDERTLFERAPGSELSDDWVALDGGGRPPRVESRDGTLLLLESVCTILPSAPNQVLLLEAQMAPEQIGPPAGPGWQRLAGVPLVVELGEEPDTTAQGCEIEYLVEHSLMPHAAAEPPDEGSDEEGPAEISLTTLGATRAVAVVLATSLAVGFSGRTNVVQAEEATATLGELRLRQQRVGGMSLTEIRDRFPPDPLLSTDEQGMRVKPRLDRQYRDALLAPPGTSVCWPEALEGDGARTLRFALGVAWSASVNPGRTVRFRVQAGSDVLFEESLPPGGDSWADRSVTLPEGARGALCFETSTEEGEGVLWSFWGTPEIVTPSPANDRPRTIVLISIDTLRADRLGIYGYEHPTSPVLDLLAGESLVFESHVAQTGWTLPSHVSMLTGLSPEAHGVTAQMDQVEDLFEAGFDPSTPTLAAQLREHGYATHGVASGPYLDPVFGFDRGFDTYDFVSHDASSDNSHQRSYRDITSEMVTRRGYEHLSKAGSRPLFLFLHYWDVHYDYIPSREDLEAVHPTRASEEIDYARVGHPFTGHLHPSLFALIVAAGPQRGPMVFYQRVEELLPRFPWVGQRMSVLSDLYDGEVHTVDRHLGYLFRGLRRQGRNDAMVIVTADHGEAFMEHGTLGHGLDNIHGEGMIVPLIVRAPGKAEPGRRRTPSSTRDITATLLDLAGLPNLPEAQGRSLREPRGEGENELALGHDGSYSRIQANRGKLRLIVWGRFARDQLFDVAEDPGEETDVGEQRPAERAEMRRAVARYLLTEGRGIHVAVCGDQEVTPFEITLESESPLRPAFLYGPPDTGRLVREEEGKRLRLRAHPAAGETVAMTVLVPDGVEARISVTRRGTAPPSGVVTDGVGNPLEAEHTLAGQLTDRGSLPPDLGTEEGRVYVWRTPAGEIRRAFAPDEETMEQLRALGYIRNRPQPAMPDADVD